MQRETVKDDVVSPHDENVIAPGVLIVFSGNRPCFHIVPLRLGRLDLGRDDLAALNIADNRASREHVRLQFENSTWMITDRGSTNGVFLDGVTVDKTCSLHSPRVIRIGKTLLLPVADVTPFATHGLSTNSEWIIGPRLRVALDQITAVRRSNQHVLVTGGTGSGKELAARVFHDGAQRDSTSERPFIAVNCATIPLGIAERILFGTKRGAYSGADADAKGMLQAAHGGTLFLDEIGDIEVSVQAKLLRAIESKEVIPVGGHQPIAVDFALCAATHKDLRAEVGAGRFREDLYFRIGRPEIRLASIFERPEEIPWLVQRAIASINVEMTADAELVEQCLLRPWPGNVRELLAEIRGAAIAAKGEKQVSARHLGKSAGTSLHGTLRLPSTTKETPAEVLPNAEENEHPIAKSLRQSGGNVSRASEMLGMTRSKVRRFIEKTGQDVSSMRKK